MNPSSSAQALQQEQQFQSTMQTPQQELSAANQSLGVNQAQQQVQGLQGAINNTTNLLNQVAPSVEGRTQNSLVTSAQAGKQIENEQAPIQANLSKDAQDYNTANSNYTNLETQAQNQANSSEQSQSNQLAYLQNIYNDLYTQEQNTAQSQTQQSQFAQNLAETQREANLSASSAANSPSLLEGSGSNVGGVNIDPAQQQAANALVALFKTNNVGTIASTINAIKKSASYGNTYDQAKQSLLQEYLKSSPYANLIQKALGAGGVV